MSSDVDQGVRVRAKRALVAALPRPVYSMIRRGRVARSVRRYPVRDVVQTFCGHRLTVHLGDPLAEGWYGHDWEFRSEIELLLRLDVLREGAVVFDLGAHHAVVALILAAEVGPEGHVVAVEAGAHNAEVARRNVALNHASNVTVEHAAVAAEPGTVHFAAGLNGHIDSSKLGNVAVPAVTIDSLAARYGHPDLVFLDIEGYEGQALDGAAATLASGTTSFLIEVHVEELVGCSAPDIVARFGDAFDVYVTPSEDEPFAPLDGAALPETRFFMAAIATRS